MLPRTTRQRDQRQVLLLKLRHFLGLDDHLRASVDRVDRADRSPPAPAATSGPATLSAVPSKDATCRGVSPKSGSRPLGGEREMQPEPLPGRIFNPTIAAEGRQNVAEKGHSFSERREAEIEPPENAYLRVGKIGVAEFGQSAVSPCTFKAPNNQPIFSIPGSRTGR